MLRQAAFMIGNWQQIQKKKYSPFLHDYLGVELVTIKCSVFFLHNN